VKLWDSLLSPPSGSNELRTWEGDGFRAESWDSVVSAGERAAVGLRKRGVEPGSVVACVLTNTFEVCAGLLGIWLAGGVVASLPTPARGLEVEAYIRQIEQLCRVSGASLLLLEEAFAGAVRLADGPPVESFSRLASPGSLNPSPVAEDEPAFVQYSSGSTSAPKGCMLTPQAIAAQLGMLIERLDGDTTVDRGYSWLPLSHDMGLFGGLLLPWVEGGRMTLSAPLRFLRSPRTWLDDCAQTGATLTMGPNFGLGLAMKAARRWPPPSTLALRAWMLGSDPIEARFLEEAIELLAPFGFQTTTFTPGYGLAEATLAVTMTRRDVELTTMPVSIEALYRGEIRAPSGSPSELVTRMVSTGPPMVGAEVRIDGPGDVGEILVKSASLARGYLGDPQRTAKAFGDNGELRTGDVGFIRDGELYVVGRQDDMMAVNGLNVPAAEVECHLSRDPRVRDGACVLLDVHTNDRRELVVLSEPADDSTDFQVAAQSMRKLAATAAGVGISECIFLARGTMPKSPSGKPQRFRCRQLISDNSSDTLARIRVG
jgi:fatty-acyl-CoA synthase